MRQRCRQHVCRGLDGAQFVACHNHRLVHLAGVNPPLNRLAKRIDILPCLKAEACRALGQIGYAGDSCKMLFWFWRRFWMYANPFPVTKVRV